MKRTDQDQDTSREREHKGAELHEPASEASLPAESTGGLQKAVPERPADTTWTEEQWEAIVRRGENILVAAAAGSGKTAVLVERIIRRISDERDPVDVDRLLVATFTNAAASEMKQRVRDALEKALFEQPDSPFLKRQLALLNRASITTLHSFCLDVIRRHFQQIGLDPGFRIANETEAELLRQDVLEELFEESYSSSEEESEFWSLLDWFGGERSDEALFGLVLQLYDASRSHPHPSGWLRTMSGLFRTKDREPDVWFNSLYRDIRLELEGIAGLLEEGMRLTRQPGGPVPYQSSLMEELAMTESLAALCGGDWNALYEAFQSASFGRLKACRGEGLDKSLQEKVKSVRDKAKERFAALKDELFSRSPEQYKDELEQMYPLMNELVRLTEQFAERFSQAKQSKGLIDFTDLEHYCLQVLTAHGSNEDDMEPSQAAMEYRDQYIEILLDEYQDTNLVQEAIIQLISRKDQGNRFMVGDVKQSIYRFRLAEPGLFLAKYKSYGSGGGNRRIDLANNFRSRKQVVDGVNFLFRQMMNETVAEMNYDRKAELVYGASYYDQSGRDDRELPIEWMLVDRSGDDAFSSGNVIGAESREDENNTGDTANSGGPLSDEVREMETAQMEARAAALQIRKLLGVDGGDPYLVYDKKANGMRPVTYRDIVILLRATQSWAPVFIEEFRQLGIPGYADLNTGYFSAVEVEIVLALLKVIDNPYQDIPLAGVLRSPIVGLTADELSRIRLASPKGSFYQAMSIYLSKLKSQEQSELYRKINHFHQQLNQWRTAARHGSLAELVWGIFQQTGYYDFVGGMPGGLQRQANLRALHDRARQYESTSFRGLFRFLRFVERMRDSGGDLGTARALGEQEDVVRIISIHKSKGLEFPVVFVAGTGKLFNQRDLNDTFLIHKELGFGPQFVDLENRVSYPSLPALAIKRRMRMEMLAEEMRVLYVALTRAREKLFLLGSVPSLAKQLDSWSGTDMDHDVLPDYVLAKARNYLDWLGPALIKHRHSGRLRETAHMISSVSDSMGSDPSEWEVSVIQPGMLVQEAAAAQQLHTEQEERLDSLRELLPVNLADSPLKEAAAARIGWQYPYPEASRMLTKTSVTELKRINEQLDMERDTGLITTSSPALPKAPSKTNPAGLFRRPRFVENRQISAAEKGTLYHAVLQQLPLDREMSEEEIPAFLQLMVESKRITEQQRSEIDPSLVTAFLRSRIGQRLVQAKRVEREIPFNYGLPASAVYPGSSGAIQQETVLIQGIVDCLFEEEDGWVLLDYKTDRMEGRDPLNWAERYKVQLGLYAKAVEHIWKRPLKDVYLVFLDGPHEVDMGSRIDRS